MNRWSCRSWTPSPGDEIFSSGDFLTLEREQMIFGWLMKDEKILNLILIPFNMMITFSFEINIGINQMLSIINQFISLTKT
jgi:hypothetical protein